jgi:hypothetical protein
MFVGMVAGCGDDMADQAADLLGAEGYELSINVFAAPFAASAARMAARAAIERVTCRYQAR